MRFIVPLTAALVPLLITPGLLSHFDVTPKVAILLLGCALILLYPSLNVQNFYNLVRAPEGRWLAILLGAAWLSAAFATLFSTHPALSLNGSIWRRLGFVTESAVLLFAGLTAAWLASSRGNWQTLLRACTWSGAIAALYGIAQYFGWDPLLPVKAYEVGEGRFMIVRPPGTLGHADYFAAWLVAVVFLALALAQLETARWRRSAAVWVAVLAAVAIVLSGTRSAMLGLLAGGIVFLAAGRFRIGARPAVVGLAFAIALVSFFFSSSGLKLRARLHWSLEDVRGGARLLLWKDSALMAARRPLTGFGPETFTTEFPRFESVELARAYPDFYHESPHNIFLDAFTSQGVFGLLAILAMCGLGAWCVWRAVRVPSPVTAPLAAALAGLLAAQQFIGFVLATSLYFYIIVVLLVATSVPDSKTPVKAPRSSRLVLPITIAVSLFLVRYAARLVIPDAALEIAQRNIAAGDVSGATHAYRAVLRWHLEGTGDDLAYSLAMQGLATKSPIFATRLAARQQALEAGVRAVSSAEDRQNAWYHLATLLAGNDDAVGVERALRSAIAWAPNWFKPHWTLAQVLALSGHRQEALAESRAAVERDGSHDDQVTETWKTLQNNSAR